MPEPPLGSATPRDRGGVRGAVGRIVKPIISVDPNAGNAINRITGAVRALKAEMKGLADEAVRYKNAAPGAATGTARVTGFQPHMTVDPNVGGPPSRFGVQPRLQPRVPGFQPSMTPAGGPGGGAGAPGSTTANIVRGGVEFEIYRRLFQMASNAMSGTMQAGGVTNRLALMNQQPGQPFQGIGPGGGGTAGPYGGMLRKAGGYWSREDLYQGGAILGRAGVIRGTDQASYLQAQQAGQLGRLSGTNFAGGAGIISNLQASANQLRMANVQVSPGGVARAPSDIFESLYQRMTRGTTDKKTALKMFQTGQAEGTMTREGLKGLGLSDETIDAFMAFGAIRAQAGKALNPEQFGKAVDKNISNASESMRKFHESMAKLTDSLSTSLLPLFTGLANIISPVLNAFSSMTSDLGTTGKAIVVLGLAAAATAAKMAWSNAGGLSGIAGKLGGGAGAAEEGAGLGLAGFIPPLAAIAGGQIAGGAISNIGAKDGKKNAAARAGGTMTKYLGAGLAAGLATAGPTAGLSVLGGLAIGGVAGLGHLGLRAIGAVGDPVTRAWSGQHAIFQHGVGDAQTDQELLANPPPPATTPGGGPLPGPGNSANLNPSFTEALKAMFAENPKLSVTSGWRSSQEQAYLRWKHLVGLKPEPVAAVGQSRHETGNAADIGPSSEYKWLADNAGKYGLKATVGGEPWHWELSGAGASSYKPPPSAPSAKPAQKAAASTPAAQARPAAVPKGKVHVASQNEADWIATILKTSTGPGGNAHSDVGDPVASAFGTGAGRGGGGTSVSIQNLTLKVEIAKGTPDEAERAARYLMEIFSDRDKLEALARK